MLTVILLVVVSAILAYVSKFNAMPVSVNLGTFVISDIPLFYVIVGSFLLGLILFYLVNLVNSVFMSFALRGKDNKLKKSKDDVLELTKRIHQLELENEKLKHTPILEPEDSNSL